LIAHDGHDVIHRDHLLLIDQGLSLADFAREGPYPDFGVDFVARLEVFADIVLFLSDGSKLLATLDANPAD